MMHIQYVQYSVDNAIPFFNQVAEKGDKAFQIDTEVETVHTVQTTMIESLHENQASHGYCGREIRIIFGHGSVLAHLNDCS